MDNLPATLADATPDVILKRYLSDESTKEIAASYGVTRQALGQFLLKHAEEQWKAAQVARALARKEAAEDDLESASATPDMLSLARARERLRAAQWDLERVCRRIYGQDSTGSTQAAVTINIVAGSQRTAQQYDSERSAAGPVIEGLVVDKSE